MAILEIVEVGNNVLREKAVPLKKINKSILTLLDDMAETMYAAEGVGLAAPQVNVSKRIVVIDVGDGLIELINPVIVKASGCIRGEEGCLSVPDESGEVDRYAEVLVRGLNRRGKEVTVKGTGYLAIALQHEIDHLEGILYIDRVRG